MSVILVDTTSYLKLSKGLHPLLGRPVGHPPRPCQILSEVDSEFEKKSTLANTFYWVMEAQFAANRAPNLLSALSVGLQEVKEWREQVTAWAQMNRRDYKDRGLTPPSPADCLLIAYGIAASEKWKTRTAIVSDDGGVRYTVAQLDYSDALSGWEVVKMFCDAQLITLAEVKQIYGHLDHLAELPRDWRENSKAAFGF